MMNNSGLLKLRLTNSDSIHPNKVGHRIIAESLFEYISPD